MNKVLGRLLKKRGIDEDFLNPKYEDLTAPENLPDMEKAVERVLRARDKKEKVLIYGDYDVDGVTATTIMVNTLEMVGITEVDTMLPDRFIDGYGMSQRLVDRVKKEQFPLVITVDCGSNNEEIIDQLNQLGTEVIVTDHHEILGNLPEAIAVVNPKRLDFRLEVKNNKKIAGLEDLSGAGVAFMLAKALTNRKAIPEGMEKWLLDLATVGIICDAMNLTRDNRIICHYGFIVLGKTRRPGFQELLKVSDVRKLNSMAVGYQIGPRLNAAGRMETAEKALELLTTKSRVKAAELADNLNGLNIGRRTQQQQALKEVEENGVGEEPVLVITGKWSEGIVGIIAGKLMEKYKRPSFVLTEVDGDYKGSGRSFGDFNLALALDECQDVIASGGGHAAACGVRLPKEMLDSFKQKINDYYRSLNLENQKKYLDVQADLDIYELADLDTELMEGLQKMEPFGEGNQEPVFCLKDMFVLSMTKMGSEQQHLSLTIRDDFGVTMRLVAFYADDEWMDISPGTQLDVWVHLTENEWRDQKTIEGRILKLGVVI